MANKHSVSITKKTHDRLVSLSVEGNRSKSGTVKLLIDAVCEGNMSVADAARTIINAKGES